MNLFAYSHSVYSCWSAEVNIYDFQLMVLYKYQISSFVHCEKQTSIDSMSLNTLLIEIVIKVNLKCMDECGDHALFVDVHVWNILDFENIPNVKKIIIIIIESGVKDALSKVLRTFLKYNKCTYIWCTRSYETFDLNIASITTAKRSSRRREMFSDRSLVSLSVHLC